MGKFLRNSLYKYHNKMSTVYIKIKKKTKTRIRNISKGVLNEKISFYKINLP